MKTLTDIEFPFTKEVFDKFDRKWQDILDINDILITWAKKEAHLSHIPIEKVPIGKMANCIINCKFSMERCKQNLDSYYSIRNILPELYADWDVTSEQNQQIFDAHCVLALPNLTPKEYEVVIVIHIVDPDKFDYWGMIKLMMLVCELKCRSVVCNGIQVIVDMSNMRLSHLTHMNFTGLKRARQILGQVYSLRIFGIHLVNTQNFVQSLLELLKLVLKPKLFNRIHIHNDWDSLYEIIPKNMLPKEYGGELPELLTLYRNQVEDFKNIRDDLLWCVQWKSEESKREQKKYNNDCLDGTFKRLTID